MRFMSRPNNRAADPYDECIASELQSDSDSASRIEHEEPKDLERVVHIA